MSASLLDVNVLVALFDSEHTRHAVARSWLRAHVGGWATCPITENGVVRILSQQTYSHPVTVSEAQSLLVRAAAGRDFWPCDVSIADPRAIDMSKVHGHRQITDVYLLALAVAHGGRLVTFDRRIALSAVPGATEEHLVVL